MRRRGEGGRGRGRGVVIKDDIYILIFCSRVYVGRQINPRRKKLLNSLLIFFFFFFLPKRTV